MAKLSITRLPDTAKLLATNAGQELSDLIDYVNQMASEVIRALRGGLTLSENVACKFFEVSLKHDTANVVSTDGRTPVGLFVVKVGSLTYGVDSLSWWIDSDSKLQVKPFYKPVPPSAEVSQKVTLVILF